MVNADEIQKGEHIMEFSEKLLTLRKANNLTQEQLAEKLDVSRQSVSKWESGQATPEMERITQLSAVFNVTTDYLLKSSEINDLSVKTEMLEKQQQNILQREKRQKQILGCVMYSVAIYLIFFAACVVQHYCFVYYHVSGSKSVILAEFLAATAIVIVLWVKNMTKQSH